VNQEHSSGSPSKDPHRAQLVSDMRAIFEGQIDEMVERHLEVPIPKVIPLHHFALGSTECSSSFHSGHFTACIVLAQAVAEGIAKFVCFRSGVRETETPIFREDSHLDRIRDLHSANHISDQCVVAFHLIRGFQRNDFHHMNPTVLCNKIELERTARCALRNLALIEDEIFAFDWAANSGVSPKKPLFWDRDQHGTYPVYLRMI